MSNPDDLIRAWVKKDCINQRNCYNVVESEFSVKIMIDDLRSIFNSINNDWYMAFYIKNTKYGDFLFNSIMDNDLIQNQINKNGDMWDKHLLPI